MTKISNLYAARVFAEHPLALWSLDDENYFNTSLNGLNYSLDNWQILNNNGEWETSYVNPPNNPFPDGDLAVLSKTSSASVTSTQINASPIYISDLDLSKDSICISTWLYQYGALVEEFEVGFSYTSGSVETVVGSSISSLGSGIWQTLHHTLLLPESFDYITPFVKVNYFEEAGSSSEFQVMFNNTAVAQWSEEYLYQGKGIQKEEFSIQIIKDILPQTNFKVYPLDTYGFQDQDNGYAIIDENKLLAKNTNFSMVYGSDNLTSIESPITDGMPSIMFPGKGFLNRSGKYKNLTAEFWLRVSPNNNISARIFGPISSLDGLYVENEYLTLHVGKHSQSYFVGKWYRPMLVDIRYGLSLITVLINGDVVIELDVDINNLEFPYQVYDWLAFYGNENIKPFDIDCVAIYPYLVSDQIAKRRFIYGQAVLPAESITENFDGESYYTDFPFANYSSIMNYPDMNPWNSGYLNNLESNSKYLGFDDYELPELRFVGEAQTLTTSLVSQNWNEYESLTWYEILSQSWQDVSITNENIVNDIYIDNFLIQSSASAPFFTLKPNLGYDNVNSSIEFDTIKPIQNNVASIYGVFRTEDELPAVETPETLMYFYNSNNNNVFKVTVDVSGLKYIYNNTLIKNISILESSDFIAGIDIDKLRINYPDTLGNFFANPQNISLSLLGYGDSTYSGKLYQFTFNNLFFHEKDTYSLFDDEGIALSDSSSSDMEYVGNYTVKPILTPTYLNLDVSCAGYWEDSIPLSYFGKQVTSAGGLQYFDLDMIQFNIDIPTQVLTSPSASSYALSDLVKTYVTLQDSDNVGNIAYSTYTNTQEIGAGRVLDFDNTNDVVETKFEVVDGTIIIPPKELVDFKDYYITIHIEAKVEGISNKPLQIRKMLLSSLVTNEKTFTEIGTRTGNKIYPVAKYNRTYSFKDKNPFTIYPETSPYLYLTGNSGITMLPYTSQAERGFSIPINKNRKASYFLGGVQFWAMYNKDNLIDSTKKIARVSTIDKTYDFFIEPIDNGKRGILKGYDVETGFISDIINEVVGDILFYQDGYLIKNPIINPLKWTSIVIAFGSSIQSPLASGSLELYEGALYNNISIYEKPQITSNFTVGSRNWQEARFTDIETETESITTENQWDDWLVYTWTELYAPVELFKFAIDGKNILESYSGTAGVVIDDNATILFNSNGADLFSNVTWETRLVKPV
jgi:hypothetical protein